MLAFRRLAPLLLFLFGNVSALAVRSQEPRVPDHLQPEDGSFLLVGTDVYKGALAEALLGEHGNKQCQMLAIPSFEAEWAVYVVRDEKGSNPILFAKEMEKHLYAELMQAVLDLDPKGETYDSTRVPEVLSRLPKRVKTWRLEIDLATADLLARVWSEMLQRVRYPSPAECCGSGCDGVNYHAADQTSALGPRAGTVWSPDLHTVTGDFVELAEAMRSAAEVGPAGRQRSLADLSIRARLLADRLAYEPK
jgi:hypothetical protein